MNIFSLLFPKKRTVYARRIRNTNGMYARRIIVKHNGQPVDYLYRASTKGFVASGLH